MSELPPAAGPPPRPARRRLLRLAAPAAACLPEQPSCDELSLAQLAPLQVRPDTRTAHNRRRSGLDRRASPEPGVQGRQVAGARHGPPQRCHQGSCKSLLLWRLAVATETAPDAITAACAGHQL